MTLLSSPQLAASTTESAVWHFDEFVLDLQRYELRRDGALVRMEPQVFDVMTQLVSNHQRLVTKNELFDTVWGGRFVGEAALTSRIKAARRALGDDGESQRFIRTVRGRGYRFVGTIIDAAPPRPADSHRLRYQVDVIGDRNRRLYRLLDYVTPEEYETAYYARLRASQPA